MEETTATTDTTSDVLFEAAPATETVEAPASDVPAENSQQAEIPKDDPFGFPADQDTNAENDQEVVPEKYEFNLPEGLEMTPEIESKFTEVAKAAGITQSQADSLVKIHSDIIMGIQQNAEKVKNEWAAECKKQGLSTDVNLRAAKLAIDTFGGGAAMTALVESGVAFNPAVQKMLQNIGHILSEDNAPDGSHAGKETSTADLLFANSKY